MTMVELGNVIASYFGTTFDFHNFMTNMAAKVCGACPQSLLWSL